MLDSIDFGKITDDISSSFPKKPTLQDFENGVMGQQKYPSANNEIVDFFTNDGYLDNPFKAINDPTITGFKIYFHFSENSGLLGRENEEYPNTALSYLKRIGQTNRYNALKKFIYILSKLSSEVSWIFQDVEGIQELFTQPFGTIHKEGQISIKTLETIDGKIANLIALHRHIVFDEQRGVYVLPQNLRRFSFSIYVYDPTIFRSNNRVEYVERDNDGKLITSAIKTKSSQQPKLVDEKDTYVMQYLRNIYNKDLKNLNRYCFDFGHCEFSTLSGGAYLEKISNSSPEYVNNIIVINTEKMNVSSFFRTVSQIPLNQHTISAEEHLNVALSSYTAKSNYEDALNGKDAYYNKINKDGKIIDNQFSWLNKLGHDSIENNQFINEATKRYEDFVNPNYWTTQLKNAGTTYSQQLINEINSKMSKLYLGNVYGFDIGNILQFGENGNVPQQVKSIKQTTNLTRSLNSDTPTSEPFGSMGNIRDNDNLFG